MRQPRKVLWVVLSSLFIKKFETMARETYGHMFASGKGKQQSRFDSYGVRKCIAHIPYYLSGLSRAHFFPTTFLEIAVYQLGSKKSQLIYSVFASFSSLQSVEKKVAAMAHVRCINGLLKTAILLGGKTLMSLYVLCKF